MKPVQQEVLASLVSWSPWTNRILEERNDKKLEAARQGKLTSSPSSPAQDQEDKKSGSKKVVTWDELVSSEPSVTFLWSQFI